MIEGVRIRGWSATLLVIGVTVLVAATACTRRAAPSEPDPDEPVLMGRMSADEVLHHDSAYGDGFSAYEPDLGAVELIAFTETEIAIEVVWGSWCSDSDRELPHFFKILDRAREVRARLGLGELPIRIEFVAVDREKTEPADMLEGKFIERVPTFIVRRDGKEVGRIIETPQGLLEEDLAVLILEAAAPPE